MVPLLLPPLLSPPPGCGQVVQSGQVPVQPLLPEPRLRVKGGMFVGYEQL